MDHTFYSISSSYVNRSGTSTFSDSNQKSSPYVGFS
nr:NADH-plastoquinone oxidoreductase subunit 5 [Pueraria alopecuroides]UJI61142.1 NADH-plastoquinone oxidoreductase subunit 5 [Pueraria montana var. lobata]UZA65057.1 NADH-plastoquinone oxidoreductase subunit 5 [Pueraria edulis]UZA65141.1 NADH-plastoquinone oxidoreductase subunit 5 [Pueraria montana var. thomsonii]UZA65310.1 NADH-plastoquinone oxidoreductase subunit 5 [Pueraria montana]WOV67534.1 NADH-plastoquinone oxidoreductase subunit 5 [Pueraria alopecuroides]